MNISIFLRRCGAAAALVALTVPAYAGDENEAPMGDPKPTDKPDTAKTDTQKTDGDKPGNAGKAGKRGRRGERAPSKLFAAIDTDKDRNFSAEELTNSSKALLSLDKNEDGQLTADEFGMRRGERGERGGRGGRGGNPMSRLDKDGDGKISKDEAPERMRERFDDIDANSDGFIDAEEQKALMERMRRGRDGRRGADGADGGGPPGANGADGADGADAPKAGPQDGGKGRGGRNGRGGRARRGRGGDPIAMTLDVDKNGSLSADEIKNAPAALLALDKNKDGKVAMSEVMAVARRHAVAGMIERLDKDGDGKVSIEEAPDRMLENWDRLDQDGDGYITADEMGSMGGGRREGGGKKKKKIK